MGIGIYVWAQMFHSDWSYLKTILVTMVPLPVVAFVIARHAKAYFLAVDHLCDPHISPSEEEGGGDGGGGSKTRPVMPSTAGRTPRAPIRPARRGSGIEWEREAAERKEAREQDVAGDALGRSLLSSRNHFDALVHQYCSVPPVASRLRLSSNQLTIW